MERDQTLYLPQSSICRCFSLKYLCLYNQLSFSITKLFPSKVTVHLTIVKFHLCSSSPGLWFIHTLWALVPPASLASFPTNDVTLLISSETQMPQTQLQTPSCTKRWRLLSPLSKEKKEVRILTVIKHRKKSPQERESQWESDEWGR